MRAPAVSHGVFVYANPGVIRWGPGSVDSLVDELERAGAHRPAVVTTRSVAADPALLGRILALLGDVPVVLIGQHAPVGQIADAVATLAASAPDALVSVGGGSPIDAAKVIAGDLAAKAAGTRVAHIAVPTTLSVAELAAGAGVTDESGNKVGRRDPAALPDAVIYDGELALRTPLPLWLSTGIRALDHAVEGFLTPGDHPLSDVLSVEAVGRLFESLPRAQSSPADPAVRTENQVAAWLAYTLPAATAAGLSHVLGKQIGARHAIPHGVTSCLLLPHTLRYRARAEEGRVRALAVATGFGGDIERLAAAIEALVAELDLPRHLAGFSLGDDDLWRAASGVGGDHPVDDLVGIYRAAW